jgi:glycosyltransferase involved in cell wall biosynthesis
VGIIKFSIIVPTFDSGLSLSNCLTSIVNQTFTDYEVIIIDNNSKDNTLEIISDFSSKHNNIRWISESDRGIYDAMNKGIKIAKGSWLYFMGSDDRFYNNSVLSQISDSIKLTPNKILYGNVLIDGDAGWAKNGQIYDGEFTLLKLIDRNISHQAIFYHKSVFKRQGGFNRKYEICADWDLNLRLWSSYTFYFSDLIIAVFKGGNSSSITPNNYTESEKWKNIARYFKASVIFGKFSSYNQRFLDLSRSYKIRHKYVKAILWRLAYILNK